MIDENDYRPIDAAARDGRPVIVMGGGSLARVRWHGDPETGMWIYDLPAPAIEQCHIRPTKYRELVPAGAFPPNRFKSS